MTIWENIGLKTCSSSLTIQSRIHLDEKWYIGNKYDQGHDWLRRWSKRLVQSNATYFWCSQPSRKKRNEDKLPTLKTAKGKIGYITLLTTFILMRMSYIKNILKIPQRRKRWKYWPMVWLSQISRIRNMKLDPHWRWWVDSNKQPFYSKNWTHK